VVDYAVISMRVPSGGQRDKARHKTGTSFAAVNFTNRSAEILTPEFCRVIKFVRPQGNMS